MKRFFKKVFQEQNDLHTKVVKKRQTTELGEIAGAHLGGGRPFSVYKKIFRNLRGSTEDYRRFATDENKLVFEKNFLINFFHSKSLTNFFIFRPYDDDGNTFFILPWRIRELFRVDRKIGSWLILSIALLVVLFAFFVRNYWFMTFLLVPFMFVFYNNTVYSARITKSGIGSKNVTTTGINAFTSDEQSVNFCSFPEKGDGPWWVKGRVSILLPPIALKKTHMFYRETLNMLMHLASTMDGHISWLWYYRRNLSSTPWEFTYTYDAKGNGHAKVTIDAGNSDYLVLIPMIETKHSFILCFDFLQDDQDISLTGDDLLVGLAKERTVCTEKMFRPVLK
ncbi:MAG TPA: hypothetical protein VG982_00780 [Candidatus Paceibacterota bacterium]|nr:hypothetical protein [Candidatus Paceibacterota bacterium]